MPADLRRLGERAVRYQNKRDSNNDGRGRGGRDGDGCGGGGGYRGRDGGGGGGGYRGREGGGGGYRDSGSSFGEKNRNYSENSYKNNFKSSGGRDSADSKYSHYNNDSCQSFGNQLPNKSATKDTNAVDYWSYNEHAEISSTGDANATSNAHATATKIREQDQQQPEQTVVDELAVNYTYQQEDGESYADTQDPSYSQDSAQPLVQYYTDESGALYYMYLNSNDTQLYYAGGDDYSTPVTDAQSTQESLTTSAEDGTQCDQITTELSSFQIGANCHL